MKLTKDQVLKVAKLARLSLTDAEVIKFQLQLSNILGFVEQLSEVDTEDVPPAAQVTGLTNVMREDEVFGHILADPEALLACTPRPKERGQIKVKNVF